VFDITLPQACRVYNKFFFISQILKKLLRKGPIFLRNIILAFTKFVFTSIRFYSKYLFYKLKNIHEISCGVKRINEVTKLQKFYEVTVLEKIVNEIAVNFDFISESTLVQIISMTFIAIVAIIARQNESIT